MSKPTAKPAIKAKRKPRSQAAKRERVTDLKALPTGAYTLEQMAAALTPRQLMACLPAAQLPADVRIAIYNVLQERQAELDKRGRGNPGVQTRAVQARMIYELHDLHGVDLNEATLIAMGLTPEPGKDADKLRKTIQKKYRAMLSDGAFENFHIGPGLSQTLRNKVRPGKK